MIEEGLWKILAFIVAVILIFVGPMITMMDRQEAITYSMVFSAAGELADVTRDTGRLDEKNLSRLFELLGATGMTYDVTLEHYKKVYVPVYDDAGVFTGTYYSSYEGLYNSELEAVLGTSGVYDMMTGDLFYVQVENRSKSPGQAAREMLLGLSGDVPVIVVRSGGMVRHEPN